MMDESNVAELPTPPPSKAAEPAEEPQMSELSMIGSIFVEPGRVFQDLRRKPRFIIAGLLIIFAFSIFQIAFVEKFGLENIVRSRIESSKRTQDLDKDAKAQIIKQQSSDIWKYITYGATPVVIAIAFFIGGLLYWGGSKAMGGDGGYLASVAVWIYSGVPPTIVFLIGNLIVMFLKSADDIDLATSQGGLVKANLGFFVDQKSMPVVAALLGSIDLFAIWGWVLAAIGLQKIAKLSSGSAWAVVAIIALIKVSFTVIGAMLF